VRLRDIGILYAPDFVINAGGVVYALGVEHLGWARHAIEERLSDIGDALAEIYTRADAEGINTQAAAERIARARLG
jgi:leucine dehydrogenase